MYLIRHTIPESELKSIQRGNSVRDVKCHLWVEEKNNTFCNMYHGGGEKQFPKEYWGLSEKRNADVCNRCKDAKRRNKEVKDNTNVPAHRQEPKGLLPKG